jgi:hypothetical protein
LLLRYPKKHSLIVDKASSHALWIRSKEETNMRLRTIGLGVTLALGLLVAALSAEMLDCS